MSTDCTAVVAFKNDGFCFLFGVFGVFGVCIVFNVFSWVQPRAMVFSATGQVPSRTREKRQSITHDRTATLSQGGRTS